MAGMGEILSALRKQKGVTQEEMGKALGVSMQAVSRWENGGAPDIMLLPALADYFSVSIDELFGREGGAIPAEAAILKRLGGLPQEARMEEAFRLCWAIQRGLSGETKFHGRRDQEALREYMAQGGKHHARVNCDSGLTEFGLGKRQNWCFLSPEPEGGRHAALYDRERHTKLFALLAQPDAYDALFLVLGRDQNPFTAKLLEKALRIPQERATEILDAFVALQLISRSTLELDDTPIQIYNVSYNAAPFIPFLTMAQNVMDIPVTFISASQFRTAPYIRKESKEVAP
ncbi:MAG TPA: helix-turn-helix transcriptional regulator [Candidatus Alectryocaccomicrobium excrementavium]|uniref:Helix-turn-helix transcriptional regulator n=1 Tax=Candidatus Alectryocaccomicrobium excrementavium TaxID=2840668 RepID=A0A9D1FXS7_9FIRM|nr:helix-turn-helix transcriptional regulator [Candidatus Alectryocaccomicrobium excrementavium]